VSKLASGGVGRRRLGPAPPPPASLASRPASPPAWVAARAGRAGGSGANGKGAVVDAALTGAAKIGRHRHARS
jgi:hypothetical protein